MVVEGVEEIFGDLRDLQDDNEGSPAWAEDLPDISGEEMVVVKKVPETMSTAENDESVVRDEEETDSATKGGSFNSEDQSVTKEKDFPPTGDRIIFS